MIGIAMFERIKAQHIVALLLSITLIVFIYIASTTESSFGGSDNYVHYRISRFAFKYPHLFFDHWGKPVFTILSAPFAQLGYIGMQGFNIVCGILSAWIAYKVSCLLKLKSSWFTAVIVLCAPMYVYSLFSAMTEPLFGLLLILSIYFFVDNKYLLSIIIISFIPFARTEGIIFIPLFLGALMILRKWRYIPFILTGFIVISTFGAPFYDNDWLWFIHFNPYTGAYDIYGSGSFWHFFIESKHIFGYPIIILTLIGILISAYFIFVDKNRNRRVHILLMLACAIGYFMAHTIVWWLGINGSLGLARVIISIVPIVAVIATFAFQIVANNNKWVRFVVMTVALFFVVKAPFQQTLFKLELEEEAKVFKKATNYLIDKNLNDRFIVYYNSIVTFFLDKDPYDPTETQEVIHNRANPSENFEKGTIIIWDSHLGPNEGGLPLENLKNDKNLRLVKIFNPDNPFIVLGGYDFQIYIFEKVGD